jgi:hypothetical protein
MKAPAPVEEEIIEEPVDEIVKRPSMKEAVRFFLGLA